LPSSSIGTTPTAVFLKCTTPYIPGVSRGVMTSSWDTLIQGLSYTAAEDLTRHPPTLVLRIFWAEIRWLLSTITFQHPRPRVVGEAETWVLVVSIGRS